ncbi:DUF4326 domain-containing protein [Curtobacterium sp. DN_7.5]|uniref:DUF4326 domain-containing protein n=1 Tax=Curtobacterium sp. DN_7.5 TaxID=3049047 RepID=UPI001F55D938|nr:DUF4326 domain-containing protein [Curtobacterium sp. DN_7.5]
MPKRIQLSRRKGWRKPEGAIVVARPSKWGNPYCVGDLTPVFRRDEWPERYDRASAVQAYRETTARHLRQAARSELAGHDLACWCPLDQPCHADVLLELANGPTP